jgi:hypothetical protein
MQNGDASLVGPQKTQSDLEKRLDAFAKELGNAGPGTAADDSGQSAVLGTPVSSPAADQNIGAQSQTEGLVIAHTGTSVGGVSAFVYPKSPRAARDSRLTFLADARAYRQLAISSNMVWANIALGSMPIQPARLTQDVATAIAMLEQLERLGIGMAYGGVAGRNTYYRDLVQRSRSGNLTDADIAQATEYAAIAEIASRLAAFAAGKGIDGFGFKGIDGFGPKGIDGFGPKGIDGFGPKGIDGFGPQRG